MEGILQLGSLLPGDSGLCQSTKLPSTHRDRLQKEQAGLLPDLRHHGSRTRSREGPVPVRAATVSLSSP